MTRHSRIMVAEDDPDLRAAIVAGLRADGHSVVDVGDGTEVQSYVHDCMFLDLPRPRIDAIVVDVCMPRMDGLTLLGYLRELGWDLSVVIVTGYATKEITELASALGAYAVLGKPLELEDLQRSVRGALASRCC